MKSAVCHSFGAELEVEDVAIRRPDSDEVLVSIAACAICHSDVAFIEGAWGGTLPAVYGHEAAGIVEEVGADVAGLRRGDRVVVTLMRSCGKCQRCLQSRPALCEGSAAWSQDTVLRTRGGAPIHQGMRTAGFAEQVTVHSSQVVEVPADVPLESASLLACGVLTGVGAVTNTAALEPGSTAIVLGVGGVGLNCVQGASLAGAGAVVAVDVAARKLEVAASFGASHTVDASVDDVRESVLQLTSGRGADYVFVAAGLSSLVEDGVGMLRRGGTLVIVGLPPSGATVALDPLAIADGSLRILGSKMGDSVPQRDIPKLVDLYRSGRLKLDELISGRYELERINEAIASSKRGEQLRPVVVFS
ncbi:MAG: zinc-binding dehydrogenase [Acidimicrobiales bacterium]